MLVVRLFLMGLPLASGCALLINPGADRPMAPIVEASLVSTRERAIAARSRGLEVPDLADPERVRQGAGNYQVMCAMCHLAPGSEPDELTRGLHPPPPNLATAPPRDPRRTFWTIKHGIKMTAMPAWGASIDDEGIWSLTAFVQALPSLSPEAYNELVESSAGHHHGGRAPRAGAKHADAGEERPDEEARHDQDGHKEQGHAEREGHAGQEGQEDREEREGHAKRRGNEDHAAPAAHDGHDDMGLMERMEMRAASGTSWQPESTPMTAFHGATGPVQWMGHGNLFALYDAQGSPRGDGQFASVNWVMVHGTVGDDDTEVGARAMLSLEPLTVGGAGYPLLGQTGETWEGRPLVDRQHPHDLFMELALQARQTFGEAAGVELYLAPVGEPALGPTAFPHRASAISDPFAPIGHHWEDATHISFGVLTAGVFNEWAKLEGSWFNGREPDENRYDLDLDVPDSWSSRLSVSLLPMWTAQVSYGWLAEPEPLEPGAPTTRITASTTFDHDGRGNGNWALTAAWGRNLHDGAASDAFLLETDLGIGNNNVFGRAEHVLKSAEELAVVDLLPSSAAGLTSLAVGNVYSLPVGPLRLGLGVRGNLLIVPADLAATYGGRAAYGGAVFVQARPGEVEMHHDRGAPKPPR
ncbi:MAG: cytochrome c [Myxococcota bacterium]